MIRKIFTSYIRLADTNPYTFSTINGVTLFMLSDFIQQTLVIKLKETADKNLKMQNELKEVELRTSEQKKENSLNLQNSPSIKKEETDLEVIENIDKLLSSEKEANKLQSASEEANSPIKKSFLSQIDFRRIFKFGLYALFSSPVVSFCYIRIFPYLTRIPPALTKTNKKFFFRELGAKLFHDYFILSVL